MTNHNWVVIYTSGDERSNDLTVINRVINNNGGDPEDPENPYHEDEKIGKIEITKVVLNEESSNEKFKVRITGPYGVVKNGELDYFEISGGKTVEVDELYYGNYKVEEIDVPGRFTVTIDNSQFVLDKIYDDEGNIIPPVTKVKITNEMSESISITGRKIWVGANGTSIEVQLYRNGKALGSPVIFGANKVTHTWANLPKTDDNGKDYKYTIDEVKVPDGYLKTISQDGLTITNTWVLGDIIWGGGGYPALIKDDHFAYVEGYPDGGFRPDSEITRAEVAAIFARLMVEKMRIGEVYHSNYSDVQVGAWYYNYIGYLTKYNILNGYPDGSFKPDNPITRAEFSKVASMFDKLSGGGSNFPDVPENHWAKRFIDSAYNKGWVKGYPDGTFRPERFLSRAETVTVINRMLARYCDEPFVLSNQSIIKYYNDGTRNHWAYFEIMEASNSHDYERIFNNRERWLRLRFND